MLGEENAGPVAVAPRGSRGPCRRALLEARRRARLEEVTELSPAYHAADLRPAAE